ncbi:MAG: hypothetical protein ACREJC_02965 [Tepidisphaeraceae bacterium]
MTEASITPGPIPRGRAVAAVCTALLVVFATLSFSAVRTKNATFDEPLHLMGGVMHRFYHDYRVNPEDPALFGLWASIPHTKDGLKVDLNSTKYRLAISDVREQWPFVVKTLYATPGFDADAYLNTSRFMFVILGLALGSLIALWSWKLGGATACIAAVAFFALDPNLLAHTALVKNDVALSVVMLGLAYSLWRLGDTGGWHWLLATAWCAAAAVNVKFSGVLCGPIIFITLMIRALLPWPWRFIGIDLCSRGSRCAAAVVSCILVALVSWAMIWACYGFRFAPTSDGELFKMQGFVDLARINELTSSQPEKDPAKLHYPSREQFEAYPGSALLHIIQWMEEKRALPQAWLFGFLYTYTTTLIRSSFLLGAQRLTGWWYYFPVTMLLKTPLATLVAAIAGATVALLAHLFTPLKKWRILGTWPLVCLLVTPTVYGVAALTTNLNLGIRHVLPLYPFIFIGIGLTASLLWRLRPQFARTAGVVLLVALSSETLLSWPNYIAFFNAGARVWRSPLELLADSNVDWGQDLRLLARWRKEHPGGTLYLCYFGTPDPAYYGLDVVHLPGGWFWGRMESTDPARPGYVAVSATHVQGVYFPEALATDYAVLRNFKPTAILGGSIYVYKWPLEQ